MVGLRHRADLAAGLPQANISSAAERSGKDTAGAAHAFAAAARPGAESPAVAGAGSDEVHSIPVAGARPGQRHAGIAGRLGGAVRVAARQTACARSDRLLFDRPSGLLVAAAAQGWFPSKPRGPPAHRLARQLLSGIFRKGLLLWYAYILSV